MVIKLKGRCERMEEAREMAFESTGMGAVTEQKDMYGTICKRFGPLVIYSMNDSDRSTFLIVFDRF